MNPQTPRKHLERSEIDELRQFLMTSPGAMTLAQAHGFFTAIGSAPSLIAPGQWQPLVLGDPAFLSMKHAQHIVGLVLRLYNQILTDLQDERFSLPKLEEHDLIEQWCTGYLMAARLDDRWSVDEHGTLLLFPFAILSGEVDLIGEEDSSGQIIDDPGPQLQRCREHLGFAVLELHQYWAPWRGKDLQPPTPLRPAKIGRNESCPCGSGRKFKKCCALKVH